MAAMVAATKGALVASMTVSEKVMVVSRAIVGE